MSTSMTRKERIEKIKELSNNYSLLQRRRDTIYKLLFEEILIGKLESLLIRKDINLDDLIHFSNTEADTELRSLEKQAIEREVDNEI